MIPYFFFAILLDLAYLIHKRIQFICYCLYLVGDQDYFYLYEIAPLFYFLANLRVKLLENFLSGTWQG